MTRRSTLFLRTTGELDLTKGKKKQGKDKRLKKNSKPGTLCNIKIASEMKNNTWRNEEKLLQVAHATGENKNTTVLQEEKNKIQLLQKELDRISALHKELNERYQTDVTTIRQQTNNFQCGLNNEVQQKQLLQANFLDLQAAYGLL